MTPSAMGLLRRHRGVRRGHRIRPQDPERRPDARTPRTSSSGSATHRPDDELVIDVITHSRGGLVTRSLVRRPADLDWPGRVDRIIFVAATNGGTHLADPDRWHDLIDLYTNLASVGAGALAAIPGGAPVAAVVGGVVKGIGAFVKYLVSYVGEDNGVPGLAAMMPSGPFVTEINKGSPISRIQGRTGSSSRPTSTSSSSTTPTGRRSSPRARRQARGGLRRRALQGRQRPRRRHGLDGRIGLPIGGFVAESRMFGTNDRIYHTNYFSQLEGHRGDRGVAPARDGRRWRAERLPEHGRAEPRAGRAGNRRWPRRHPDSLAERPRRHRAATGRARAGRADGGHPCRGDAGDRGGRGNVRGLRHAVSQGHRGGRGHGPRLAKVAVEAERPVSVQVVGKSNAEVIGPTRHPRAPPRRRRVVRPFTVRALSTGPVVVHAIVRQGGCRSRPYASRRRRLRASPRCTGPPARAQIHTGIDAPELDGLPCLDIIESAQPDGSVIYKYAVRVEQDGRPVAFQSLPIVDRARTMAAFLDEVQQIVGADLSEAQVLRVCRTSAPASTTCSCRRTCRPTSGSTATRSATSSSTPTSPTSLGSSCISSHPGVRGRRSLGSWRRAAWCVGVSAASRRRRSGSARVAPGRSSRTTVTRVSSCRTGPRAALPRGALRGQPGTCDARRVLQLLRGGRFDLLHFSATAPRRWRTSSVPASCSRDASGAGPWSSSSSRRPR